MILVLDAEKDGTETKGLDECIVSCGILTSLLRSQSQTAAKQFNIQQFYSLVGGVLFCFVFAALFRVGGRGGAGGVGQKAPYFTRT